MTRRVLFAVSLAVLAWTAVLVSPPAAAQEEGKPENPVSAIVNGEKIFLSDVNEARARLPQQYQAAPLQAVFPVLLESLISSKLAAAAARKSGMRQEEEVVNLLARIEEQVLERAYLSRRIDERLTDELLKTSYDKMVAGMGTQEEVNASHILVDNEATAREITASLAAGGDFAELAEKHSSDPGSAKKGGDLGFFKHEQMVAAFAEAAFALEKGAITENPVQTEFGWHVIKLVDRRTAAPPPLEQVADQLRNELAQEIGSQVVKALREGADVQAFAMDGSPAAEPAAAEPAAAEPAAEEPEKKEETEEKKQ